MKIISFIFLISLLFGTVSGITPIPGVTIYIHDVWLSFFLIAGCIAILVKKKFASPKLLVPIAGFTIAGILSLLVNSFRLPLPTLVESSLYLLRWILYVGIYIVIIQMFVPASFWLWGLASVGWGFALMGLLQYVLYPSLRNLSYLGWDPHYFRLFSTLLDPNFTGILLVLSFLLTFFLWRKTKRYWLFAPMVLLIISLYLTYSRSSYLAFFVGFGYLIYRLLERKMPAIIALLLFILFIVIMPKPGGDTLRLDRMVSTVARVENWQESVKRIGQSPIFGFGFNTLRFTLPGRSGIDMTSKAASGADNSLLFILLTTGIAGFAVYCWLIVKQIRLIREPIFLASVVAVLVHSMFVNSLFYPWVMIWMWIMTGIVESYLL